MYVLGYDLGSSSVKCSLVDGRTGAVVASAKYPDREMQIHAPEPGMAEQDPEEWWQAIRHATSRLLDQIEIDTSQIQSIGIAHQMHGLVCLDGHGEVLRPAIIWCDSRAIELGKEMTDHLGSAYCEANLLNHIGNFTAAKLAWVRKHEPQLFDQIKTIMLPGDYIAYRLSGEMTTTPGNLSEGIFWDYQSGDISGAVVNALGIDRERFPEVQACFSIHGSTTTCLVDCGLPAGIPISYKGGDQPTNALCLGVLEPGQMAGTGGTSGVIYGVNDQLISDPSQCVNSFAHVNYGEVDRIGVLLCINATGIFYAWIRRLVGGDMSYSEMEELASMAPRGCDGLIALPFGNGAERMLGNRSIGAQLIGIDLNRHDRSHIVRAALEGLAMAYHFGIMKMRNLGIEVNHIRVGNDNLFQSHVFSQLLSDLAGIEIEVCNSSGARGAALGSLQGIGDAHGMRLLEDDQDVVGSFGPAENVDEAIELFQRWEAELEKRLG